MPVVDKGSRVDVCCRKERKTLRDMQRTLQWTKAYPRSSSVAVVLPKVLCDDSDALVDDRRKVCFR